MTARMPDTAPAPRPRPRAARRRGVAALEVALLLPVLAGLLFLLVEGGAVLRAYSAISEASRAAARQVIVSGNASAEAASALVRSLAPDLASAGLTTTVTTDPTGSTVTVEVSYAYQSFFRDNPTGLGHEPLLTLVAHTSMPVP
ncbi:TadE/TadG family type IV pilus assembly protein [Desulfocurvus vexinensis]|uniref:TadE/TadG family type IV pilus assembly protein n=1 Tax=Desulfocurvus vexinensis TaxID=399548 RepID=UPI0004B42FBB|nr:TadE/TadG family type IV pilus assembly protein [Desulfocurvus vexinensis]